MNTPVQPFAPTTRSRTLLFISYRDSTQRSSRPIQIQTYDDAQDNPDDEHVHLMHASQLNSSSHLSLDMRLPPKWVDISDQVHEILAGTKAKIAALEKLHAKHALPGFADRSNEEREIEQATTDITKDFRRCQALIQEISVSQPHAFPPTNIRRTRHEALAAQNVQRGLAATVQELSAAFRKKQRVYMETLQGHAIKNKDLLVASGAVTLKGSEGMSDLYEDVQVATQKQPQFEQELLEPDLQSRTREITEIAKSIAALADLFKDLSSLVIDQGTLLDSIEYNIEQTSVQMAEAVTELKIATRYQKNTGRRKCIFLLLLIIFGLIVVLILKPRKRNPASPSVPITSATHVRTEAPSFRIV